MALGNRRATGPLLAVLTVLALLVAGALPATAAEPPVPTTLTLAPLPGTAFVGTSVPLGATLLRPDAAAGTAVPVAGASVVFERYWQGAWRPTSAGVTDGAGVARGALTVLPGKADNRVRAVFAGLPDAPEPLAGATSEERTVVPALHPSVLTIAGATRVVDEKSTELQMTWRADGRPAPGVADVWQRQERGAWKKHAVVQFSATGRAFLRVTPRFDTEWKVVGRAGTWWAAATSTVHRIDNVPPEAPVAYPAAAPRPRVTLPRQARAIGAGANGWSGSIPDAVWGSMVGRSWRPGCPVGRSSLRLVKVNYWGYDGYRYRGELVVHKAIAGKTMKAFTALYAKRFPIRSMYLVDRFGYSSTLGGADNYDSMAAGNTSAFNCRGVVGNPRVRSPHSYGRSIDINTWENPYHSRRGIVPNTWWATRSHPKIGWRTSSHPVVTMLRASGFRWTYGNSDAHHFDG